MRKKTKNRILKARILSAVLMLSAMLPVQVLAATEPPIITGLRNLLTTGTNIILGLVVAVVAFASLIIGIMWIMANEEEKPKHKKRFINTIAIGILVLTSGGTIAWIVGFFQQ